MARFKITCDMTRFYGDKPYIMENQVFTVAKGENWLDALRDTISDYVSKSKASWPDTKLVSNGFDVIEGIYRTEYRNFKIEEVFKHE